MKKKFSLILKALRDRLLLTQDELAHKTNLAPSTIAQLEKGNRLPSLYTRKKIQQFALENEIYLEDLLKEE